MEKARLKRWTTRQSRCTRRTVSRIARVLRRLNPQLRFVQGEQIVVPNVGVRPQGRPHLVV